jgi:hypothetical protein
MSESLSLCHIFTFFYNLNVQLLFTITYAPCRIQSVLNQIMACVATINSVAQEPEGSPPHSQQLATGPYPEPVESNPHPLEPISIRSILIPS